HLEIIVASPAAPELVILGTGPRFQFPAAHIQKFFLQRDIGFEPMDTPAACRTYNILMAEGRNVACALLIR
ncbi:MAG: MTH938/NDUFAF3 family protein, partial [Pseudomonadota bacterium]